MEGVLDISVVLSVTSFLCTTYFWFVKARKERPNLEFYQLSDYRVACRRHPENPELKRVCLQQIKPGGVLIVNHSTRQNSVVLFDCFLRTSDGAIRGDWGYVDNDAPPWNVGPESSISFSPACFFDVPSDYELPENPEFRIEFITASGVRFSHHFAKQAPRLSSSTEQESRAA